MCWTTSSALVLRYEDFIYDKMRIARSICDWCGIDMSEQRMAAIASQQDIFPDSPQLRSHIRQVHPGDHRRQLQAATITTLDASLSGFMEAFGYEG